MQLGSRFSVGHTPGAIPAALAAQIAPGFALSCSGSVSLGTPRGRSSDQCGLGPLPTSHAAEKVEQGLGHAQQV